MTYPFGCIHGKSVVYENVLQFLRVSVGEKHYLHNGQGKCKWQQIGKLSVNHLQLLDST